MNSNSWISNILNHRDRERLAINFSFNRYQEILRTFIDEVVIIADDNFVNARIDHQLIIWLI
jgi:hypothetical protein